MEFYHRIRHRLFPSIQREPLHFMTSRETNETTQKKVHGTGYQTFEVQISKNKRNKNHKKTSDFLDFQ